MTFDRDVLLNAAAAEFSAGHALTYDAHVLLFGGARLAQLAHSNMMFPALAIAL
ncbi:hypothetical protein CSIRO_3086 [Bradyrhizobiaceae bacterium SG-6C]|nr:hypothetical protein CSIRO_3086 [Bradyrhizobiaceae bacterium SG-6C]